MIPIALGQASLKHKPLILATWIKVAQNQWDHMHQALGELDPRTFALTPHARFTSEQHRLITALVPRSRCLVAHDPDAEDDDQVYGYLVGEPQQLHFVYVRSDFRRLGVATRLLRALYPWLGERELPYTLHTPAAYHLRDKWNLIYNPFGAL